MKYILLKQKQQQDRFTSTMGIYVLYVEITANVWLLVRKASKIERMYKAECVQVDVTFKFTYIKNFYDIIGEFECDIGVKVYDFRTKYTDILLKEILIKLFPEEFL